MQEINFKARTKARNKGYSDEDLSALAFILSSSKLSILEFVLEFDANLAWRAFFFGSSSVTDCAGSPNLNKWQKEKQLKAYLR